MVETQGIMVGTQEIKVGMQRVGVGMRGIRMGIRGIMGGNAGNQGNSLLESSCLLLRLKSRKARGAFHHPAFRGSRPIISHTFFDLSSKWMSSPSRK